MRLCCCLPRPLCALPSPSLLTLFAFLHSRAIFTLLFVQMVSDPTTDDIVCWNDRGDGFMVKNEFAFASQIMRTYFRHQNFSSFVRQLNFYGFRKSTRSTLTSFYHPYFRKGQPELLSQIQRKSTESSQGAAHTALRCGETGIG